MKAQTLHGYILLALTTPSSNYNKHPNINHNRLTAHMRTFGKTWAVGGLTGLTTGLSFVLSARILSADLMFEMWEMGVSLVVIFLLGVLIAKVTHSKVLIVLGVAYLTLLIPVLGAAFGGTGSEPLWAFAILGLVGGLFWSTPFALWNLFKRRRG